MNGDEKCRSEAQADSSPRSEAGLTERQSGTCATPSDDPPGRAADVGENRSDRCNWKILEERLKEVLRIEHYSYATEKTY